MTTFFFLPLPSFPLALPLALSLLPSVLYLDFFLFLSSSSFLSYPIPAPFPYYPALVNRVREASVTTALGT